jgi:hypothetical protein
MWVRLIPYPENPWNEIELMARKFKKIYNDSSYTH